MGPYNGVIAANPVPGLSLEWPVPSAPALANNHDYAEYGDVISTHHHAGFDIPVAGLNVIAAAESTAKIYRLSDPNVNNKTHCLGNVVIITHNNGSSTLYAHLASITVDQLQDYPIIHQGEIIGTVGNTTGNKADGVTPCNAVGNHLHFELKDNAVLGTNDDDSVNWGYTPVANTTGTKSTADHPNSFNFHDPVLNLHSDITKGFGTVEIIPDGNGASMRTGPNSRYGAVGTLTTGDTYTLVNRYDFSTTSNDFNLPNVNSTAINCSMGWYQIKETDDEYIPDTVDSAGGELPEVWVCQGNNGVQWLKGVNSSACNDPTESFIHERSLTHGYHITKQNWRSPSSAGEASAV
jgi:murein DD-endopeptidase MepM/ murein hydrolase activator NlpD